MAGDRNAGRKFDLEHGVTTQAILFLTDLDPDAVGDAGAHATHYEAVPVAEFQHLIRYIPLETIEGSVFVDVGAGMGRAMLLASEHSFKRILGVEVSPGLFEVAKENIAMATGLQPGCRDISALRDDARIWNYPSGNLVVFLYNPFDGDAMRMTLGNITRREDAGETWLIYHTPAERTIIENDSRWIIVAETQKGVVYRYG